MVSEPAGSTPESTQRAPSRSTTHIEDRVFSILALQGALSVPGVIGHTSGITRFTGRKLPRSSIRWDALHTSISVDLQIAITWPSPIVDIARVVQDTVCQWILDFTGTHVVAVNVDIGAVVPSPRAHLPVTSADLDSTPRAPSLQPISTEPLTVTSPVVNRRFSLHPIRVGRPTVPAPLSMPSPVQLTPIHTTARTAVRQVNLPTFDSVTVPQAPTRHILQKVEVHRLLGSKHVESIPSQLPRVQVTHDIPTPRGPRLENIPTPRGLALTIFPQVSRRGLQPITVQRHPRITVSSPIGHAVEE